MTFLKLRFAVASFLFAGSCKEPTTPTGPTWCGTLPALDGRQMFEADLAVGKIGVTGCEGVGGTPVFVQAQGVLDTRSTWFDPKAQLKTEIWRGRFQELIASGVWQGGALCISASAFVVPGTYVVRTCHTPESGVPLASPIDSANYTQFHLIILFR